MILQKLGLLLCVFSVAFLAITCVGPRPEGTVEKLTALGNGQYRVETLVENLGKGEGKIVVRVRLRAVTSGESFQEERALNLKAHERARLAVDFTAPPAEYRAEVETEYPPR